MNCHLTNEQRKNGAMCRSFDCKSCKDFGEKKTRTIEALADYAHEAWAGWMKYLFSQSSKSEDGSVTIPTALADRWLRQMETDYNKLTEDEKESDRVEARKIISTIEEV